MRKIGESIVRTGRC